MTDEPCVGSDHLPSKSGLALAGARSDRGGTMNGLGSNVVEIGTVKSSLRLPTKRQRKRRRDTK